MDEFYNKVLLFVLKQILSRIQKFQLGIIVNTFLKLPLKKSLCMVHHTQNFLRKSSQRGLTYSD